MRRSSKSPKPGSAHKRQRLSSPTYEAHFPITQEDMLAFDEIDRQLSQKMPVIPSQSRSLPSEERGAQSASPVDADLPGNDSLLNQDGKKGVVQEWSSSPIVHPTTSRDRAAEDNFFTTGVGRGVLHDRASPSCLRASVGGFTSAAKLPNASEPHQMSNEVAKDALSFAPSKSKGFGLASALPIRPDDPYDDNRPSSPSQPPPQPDYDSWFDSDASVLPPDAFAFKTARTIMEPSNAEGGSASQAVPPVGFMSGLAQWREESHVESGSENAPNAAGPSSPTVLGFASAASVGFSSAAAMHGGKSTWSAPSADALARAEQKMKQWEDEFVREEVSKSSSSRDVENAEAGPSSSAPRPATTSFQTPFRPALRPMENSGFSPAQLPDTPLAGKNPTHYTVIGGLQIKNKQFKSPLIRKQNRAVVTPATRPGSSLNPGRTTETTFMPASASSSRLPAVFTFGSATVVPGVIPATPGYTPLSTVTSPGKGKSLGMTPRRVGAGLKSVGKSKFTTPFKPGMAPGEPGHTQLERQQKFEQNAQTQTPMLVRTSSSTKGKAKEYMFFDLNPPRERKTLTSSGLRPQSHTIEELEDMGINVEELRQISPSKAIYYSFYSADPSEEPPESLQLGSEAAFLQLKKLGCSLATQEWVTNHYGLILWKLAGMICLEPERESDPKTKRWCWPEVIRQLRYRYERELNGGSRPALRLVCTEDAPAACPMVLCVSDIVMWAPAVVDENGVPFDPHPELEVTDGWYRLRARVDQPLARAVRRGLIRVGTKLAVSGARLSGDRKEPCEILEAYDNTHLELFGNSTHLAQWHAKLGFVKEPFVATLDSLTPDGGTVPAMDLVVTKIYPIAYLEFVRNDDGTTTKLGPRDEKEELKLHDQWLAKRDAEIVKIRENLERHIQLLEKTSERLYSLAGPRFDDKFKQYEPLPSHIEDLFTEMMEEWKRPSQTFDRLNYMDAGWLYIHSLDEIKLAKERLGEDIERELQHACPPRNVRDFRVVVAKDARWWRKEPMRTAQITLWDPMRMVFSEGGAQGDVREGQRFFVTNLQPNQPRAWMALSPESMIYLVSKKGARWTNVKLSKR